MRILFLSALIGLASFSLSALNAAEKEAPTSLELHHFRPADGSPPVGRISWVQDSGSSLERPLRARTDPPGQAYLLLREDIVPAGVRINLLTRTRDLPTQVFVEGPGSPLSLTLDWSKATQSEDLVREWRDAALNEIGFYEIDHNARDFGLVAKQGLLDLSNERVRRNLLNAQRMRRRGRGDQVELFSGARAIEESLQLERLRGTGRDRSQVADVSVSTIQGVTVRPHPWKEMLKGRSPKHHEIESFVPLDQYCLEARSFAAFTELADWLDETGSPLANWMDQSAEDARVKDRVETQLCLAASTLSRTLGPFIIKRIAVTGGDPFFREGTDVTFIFELTSPDVFLANLKKNRAIAKIKHEGCRKIEESYESHTISGLVSPQRIVSSFSAVVGNYALVSNSVDALKRCISAHEGKEPSQIDGLDRRFMRTLLKNGEHEDAFIFLSDPSIRRLVSPRWKISENRRLECSASLRAVSHATAWRHMRGEAPAATIRELIDNQDLPTTMLYCPSGGEYSLLTAHRSGECSVHGSLEFLTPNSELKLDLVTKEEKETYDRFRQGYERYWDRFFDPIGIQIQLDGKRKKIDTVILPLIQLSDYRDMVDFSGGKTQQRETLVDSEAFVMSTNINREGRQFRDLESFANSMLSQNGGRGLSWIGNSASLFFGDARADLEIDSVKAAFNSLPREIVSGQDGGFRIHVRNPIVLAGFLTGMKTLLKSVLPSLKFSTMPAYRGVEFVEIDTGFEDSFYGIAPKLYYGLIGDSLFLSFNNKTLQRIVDSKTERDAARGRTVKVSVEDESAANGNPADSEKSWIEGSNLAFGAHFDKAPNWRRLLGKVYRSEGTQLCNGSIAYRSRLLQLGLFSPVQQAAFAGAMPRCSLRGTIGLNSDRQLACTHHRESKTELIDRLVHFRCTLEFIHDGLRTKIDILEK